MKPPTRRAFLTGAAASIGFATVGTAGVLMPVRRPLVPMYDRVWQDYILIPDLEHSGWKAVPYGSLNYGGWIPMPYGTAPTAPYTGLYL